MQQVLPGEDPDDPFSDPITESNDRKDAGDFVGAEKLLNEMCEADLRCLDAHAHLASARARTYPLLLSKNDPGILI